MNALAARRRHPAAIALLILVGLLIMGGAYSFIAPKDANASAAVPAASVEEGQKLFLGNCASCHGTNAQGTDSGPSLVGVGAAAVDFQVGTGRMPMAKPDVQAPRNDVKFDEDEIASLAAYVATLGPGPAIPEEDGGAVGRRVRGDAMRSLARRLGARPLGLLVALVTVERARRGELAELVPDHVLRDEHRNELAAVVDREREPDRFGNDGRTA